MLQQLNLVYLCSSDVISDFHELHHSPKLVALKEILDECGVEVDASSSEDVLGVGKHRFLIFAQHKVLMNIIERDLFHTHMKSVTYLRLDGSVEPENRFEIVKAFNADHTIDVLLLTTHVAPIAYAHLAATQISTFTKFDEMSETSLSHGGMSSAGSAPVPELPRLYENVRSSMFFLLSSLWYQEMEITKF